MVPAHLEQDDVLAGPGQLAGKCGTAGARADDDDIRFSLQRRLQHDGTASASSSRRQIASFGRLSEHVARWQRLYLGFLGSRLVNRASRS
jgi:hypothetical protein